MKEKYNLLLKKAEKEKTIEKKIERYQEAMDYAHEKEYYIESYEAAMFLMNLYVENGDYDYFEDKFLYCLDLYDSNDDIFYPHYIMWKFKEYIEHVDKTPFITLEELEQLYEDITQRFTKLNYSLRPIYLFKANAYLRRGEMDLAREWFEKFEQAEVDDMNDCEACEANASIDFLMQKDPKKAQEIIHQILSGELTCGSIPHLTYSKVLVQKHQEGNVEEALEMHQKGYEFVKQSKAFVSEIAVHLDFLVEVDIHTAFDVFNENLAIVEESCNYHGKFLFYVAAIKLKRKAKEKGILLYNFPKDIEEVVGILAEEFDERNGNDHYSGKINPNL